MSTNVPTDATPAGPVVQATARRILPPAVTGQEWVLLGVIAALWRCSRSSPRRS